MKLDERDPLDVVLVECLREPGGFGQPPIDRVPTDTFNPPDRGTTHAFDAQMRDALKDTR